MTTTTPLHSAPSPVGSLLQYWRKTRRLSQLALSHQTDVSPRHISFLETGRAKPSRQMLMLLAGALDVPLRERNTLLLAAGFAPIYGESPLDAKELDTVRTALFAILRQQEPFPAVVMNRRWDIVHANDAATRFFGWLLAGRAPVDPPNVVRLMFDPNGLRPYVENWDAVAEALIGRVRRETVGATIDEATGALLDEVLAYDGVPERLRALGPAAPSIPVVPVRFRKANYAFSYFSTVTTLGTPQDITLQELRIECFFPFDSATAANALALRDEIPVAAGG